MLLFFSIPIFSEEKCLQKPIDVRTDFMFSKFKAKQSIRDILDILEKSDVNLTQNEYEEIIYLLQETAFFCTHLRNRKFK